MPSEGVRWLPREDILSYEEIADIVRAAIEIHGIRRFKLTGGEPTVRANLLDLVATLRNIPGIADLSMTTNGFVLEHLALPLKEAGLDRVTVSIDSLRPERFRKITRTGDLAAVLRGLDRCENVGLPLKINCVAMRGTNDDEFADFARLTLSRELTVRFIEYMPLGDAALMREESAKPQAVMSSPGPSEGCGSQNRGQDAFVAETEIRSAIEREFGPLIPIDRDMESGVGPAIPYRIAQSNPVGRIGFISAMSQPFCSTCNRLRLTADGTLRSCLFEGGEVDVRSILRSEIDMRQRRQLIAEAMTKCVRHKPMVHSGRGDRQMSQIGG
jgi:GTP 3',8-cyclase